MRGVSWSGWFKKSVESIDVIEEIGRVPRTDGPVVQLIPPRSVLKLKQRSQQQDTVVWRFARTPINLYVKSSLHLKPLYKTIPVANESLNSSSVILFLMK